MRAPEHEITSEELLSYADGSLDPNRRHEIAAHVASCSRCQARLELSAEIGRLVRAATPVVDDSGRRAALMERVRQQPAPPARRRASLRPLVAGLALIVVLVAGLAIQSTTEADFRLGRFVDLLQRDAPDSASDRVGPPGHVLVRLQPSTVSEQDLAFVPTKPPSLPFDLALIEASFPSHERMELLYQSGRGLTIVVYQEVANPSTTEIRQERSTRLVVQQTEVIVERDLVGDIVRLVWERDAVVFSLIVLETGGAPLATTDATVIVAALLDAATAP